MLMEGLSVLGTRGKHVFGTQNSDVSNLAQHRPGLTVTFHAFVRDLAGARIRILLPECKCPCPPGLGTACCIVS
jgi:hypothetical protein